MTRVLLLRHAETAAPHLIHGAESDVELGPRGKEQAADVARVLAAENPDALYCSAMKRAIETAGFIETACALKMQIVPALHERIMGPLSQSSWEQSRPIWDATKARWIDGDLDASHEGGESYTQMRARLVPEFQRILDRERGKTVVVVAHGVVIKVLMTSMVEGRSHADFDRVKIEFVGVHDLQFS